MIPQFASSKRTLKKIIIKILYSYSSEKQDSLSFSQKQTFHDSFQFFIYNVKKYERNNGHATIIKMLLEGKRK